jgi:hypothetical protein
VAPLPNTGRDGNAAPLAASQIGVRPTCLLNACGFHRINASQTALPTAQAHCLLFVPVFGLAGGRSRDCWCAVMPRLKVSVSSDLSKNRAAIRKAPIWSPAVQASRIWSTLHFIQQRTEVRTACVLVERVEKVHRKRQASWFFNTPPLRSGVLQ